jgi:hypothetical protein
MVFARQGGRNRFTGGLERRGTLRLEAGIPTMILKGGKYLGCQVHALLLVSEIGLLLIHVDGNNYRRIGWFCKAKEELFVDLEDITLI